MMMEPAKDSWELIDEIVTEEDLVMVVLYESAKGEYTKFQIIGDFEVETDSYRVHVNKAYSSIYSVFNIPYAVGGHRSIDAIIEPNQGGTPYGHGTVAINGGTPAAVTRDPNNSQHVFYPITELAIRGNTKAIYAGAKFTLYGQK